MRKVQINNIKSQQQPQEQQFSHQPCRLHDPAKYVLVCPQVAGEF